ncbi:DUF378 domain-containing protein [Inquilinus limosus]|uniref:DUF378 domain-containing protein n=1 Tax=Inquilinus limosus TaxID=171674 RepID=UPI003F13BB15
MKTLNIVTLLLIIIGGLNWLLVGLFQVDLVAAIFGGVDAALARLVYLLVGISAVWQVVPLIRSVSVGEIQAERGR